MFRTRIHLGPSSERAAYAACKLTGKSFAQEVRDAVDQSLDLPFDNANKLRAFATLASESADRRIKRLEETIACVDRVLRSMIKAR